MAEAVAGTSAEARGSRLRSLRAERHRAEAARAASAGVETQGRSSNQEWASYLKATTSLQYDVARRSWIGDYLDPNTFLSCYLTGDGNNRSGWGDPRYDRMLGDATREPDAAKRFAILRRAEELLLSDGPVIPVYHYSTNELVKPYVRGIYRTPLDVHPLTYVEIDRNWNRGSAPVAARGASETPR